MPQQRTVVINGIEVDLVAEFDDGRIVAFEVKASSTYRSDHFKGLRFLLRRNWENLTMSQREVIWALEAANRRTFRAFQLKEELRDIFSLPLIAARRALDDWLAYASRSKLPPFVRLARSIRAWVPAISPPVLRCDRRHSVMPAAKIRAAPPGGSGPTRS